MLRSTITRNFKLSTRSAHRSIATPGIRQYSILDTAKEKLNELNQKVGQAAAHGIENAESTAETVKHQAENLKEEAEKFTNTSAEEAKDVVEKKAKETFGSDSVEDGKTAAKNLNNTASDLQEDIKDDFKEAGKKAKEHLD